MLSYFRNKIETKIKHIIAESRFLKSTTLLNENRQPTGAADDITIRYLALNIKALAAYLAERLISDISKRPIPPSPKVENLISKISTQEDLESDWSRYWIHELDQPFRYHRKHWEQSFIMQVLFEHGMLNQGKRGCGFGCGREPLPSYFIKKRL